VGVEFTNELGLLRKVTRNLVKKPSIFEPITQEYLRAEGLGRVAKRGEGLVGIERPAHEAFEDLAERVITEIPGMGRGVNFDNFRSELFGFVADNYTGRDAAAISADDVTALYDHFTAWFAKVATGRRIFVPCVLGHSWSPRFAIGPISFVHIDDAPRSELYPHLAPSNALERKGFDDLLQLMKDTHAFWLACVPIEGCERDRAQELAELAADLAIVALQLAAPDWGTRTMARIDNRRGPIRKRTLSESNGSYSAGWSNLDAGLPIGRGTLADIVQKTEPLATAVGSCVRAFTTGNFRFPKLESSWCDAAYWLHEALAEPLDSIAVAKLETAIEVLLQAESTSGSLQRILTVLDTFFGLKPSDPVTQGATITAKEFAKGLVRDRSRILHGTWSTLNSRMGSNRTGVQNFAITVVRRVVLELEEYALTPSPKDNLDDFLAWTVGRAAARAATRRS
jgi:hypothetical protein